MSRAPASLRRLFDTGALPVMAAVLCVGMLIAAPVRAALPIEQWTTSGGVKVLFVQTDAIPMLDVEVTFDAGSRFDPAGKAGLAASVASQLDAGAGARDEAQIADAFAALGSRRSAGAGNDAASVSIRTLTSPAELEGSLELLGDMIARPAFPAGVAERERQRGIQRIRESAERPSSIMGRTFAGLAYPDHPYGRWTTEASLLALQRDDLVAFHRDYYVQARATLAMIGAIDRSKAESIAERLMADLPTGSAVSELPQVQMPVPGETRIAHPASQSHIIIGAPLLARGDADFFPLLVGNHILGGGSFVSRLYAEIRDKRGFAYSVSSGFSPRLQPGPFSISLQTARANTNEALRVVREVFVDFVRDGPTEAEVEAARANIAGAFALSMDSNREILGLLGNIAYYRLPLDWLEQWPEKVRSVTPEQVIDAVSRRLHPDRMITVVVGEVDPGT